ncbi:MAG: septum formation initiator family protein [Pseudomonadales bacterium]|nr:septum formation initiator family protein [Pseudomonadales bacterium]
MLSERNRRLSAEVKDLKQGLGAVEERARSQLGMVKDDETFYLIIDK